MHIDKAIKKQKSSYKRVMFIMLFIFIFLPLVALILGKTSIFYLLYLSFIEILVLLTIIAVSNNEKLKFKCLNNKLKIEIGILKTPNILLCDKVVIVHTENSKEDMEIVIIVEMKKRNDQVRCINKNFLKKYPSVAEKYREVKRLRPEKSYYFTIIKKGGFYKYKLLDIIYRNCVGAIYTDSSIKNIKIARGQLKIN
ncbi:hypothetical protein [Clostridium fallax]|uniref:Uncharacterized protein n=1 Tax=Clostridium fallax TaxID=1533 RepID=A0A1M4WJ51_9CLOT|nr:hypothetical protein [Clostridium fallax]SHE81234.1 hypothetical protein SAMN05443638_11267 [Clostridium fallax]SQB05733.1 transmembrane protein [Clostridium fallax]